ncbi:MAG: hypothetical protein RBU45_12365 [Myxococcota bacterium]|jgi:hypothetical protein|nr:hypothetical protein [Myxococcota bacterium]
MRKISRTILGSLLLASGALSLGGCGDSPLEADYPLEVVARAEGAGVEGVSIKLNDEEIGQTDEEGKFEGTYKGKEGEEVTLEILPNDDFKLADGADSTFKGVLAAERPEEGEPRPKPLSFMVDLQPTSIDYVVLVQAPGKFRPIYLGTELKGRTNALGAEIIHFRGKPGSSVEVRVDTQSKKNAPLFKKISLDDSNRVITVDAADEMKEETEAQKAARVAEAQKREEAALAALEEKAKRQGKAAETKIAAAKAAPKEEEEADKADLEAVKAVSRKAAEKVQTADAKPVKVKSSAPPPPKEEPFSKEKANGIVKDLGKTVANIGKMKADAGKTKGKIDKLARQPGGAGPAGEALSAHGAAMAKIEDALARAKAAADQAKAGVKAKDMMEVNKGAQAGRLAESDAEQAKEEANEAFTRADEQVNAAVAQAKAQEAQTRDSATAAIQTATSTIASVETELKNLAKTAAGKVKTAKQGQAEAKAAKKEIDDSVKAIAGPKKEAAGLQKKVAKAKPEALPDILTAANGAKATADGLLAKSKAAMDKLLIAIGEKQVVVAAAPAPTTTGLSKKGKDPKGGKKPEKKVVEKGKEGTKCPTDIECELDALRSAVDEGEADRCLVQVCEKVPLGGANAEDIHLTLAKYWGRKSDRARQLAALEKATSFGQYKYDPSVLYGYIKVAVSARQFKKAIEIKDRFMQVKERLPVEERKTKISEILSILAQAYEHEYYKQQEKHEDQDFTPLLNTAIGFWEEFGAYSGDKAKAEEKIAALKKLRDEQVQ